MSTRNIRSVCEFGVEGDILFEFTKEKTSLQEKESLPLLEAIHDLGATFVVSQFWPEKDIESTINKFCHFATLCREAKINGFYANQEITNYSKDNEFLDEQGNDLIRSSDGCHRWDLSGELLKVISRIPEFRGVLYDEAEHGQIRRERNTNGGEDGKSSGQVHPYFAATDGMSLQEAYNAVYTSAKRMADNYHREQVDMLTEHVWPIMFHTFARAGINACPKFMKESWNSIWAAIALGAAKQYNTEFWPTLDLWGPGGFAKHSTDEFLCSLLFAYWMGATKIFVENVYLRQFNTGLLRRQTEGDTIKFIPTEYGEIYRWFIKEYVPSHPRFYTFRDVEPEIGIIRFPDSYWGQKHSWIPDALYGAKNLQATSESVAWIGLWRLLTHNYSHKDGISFHCKSYRKSQHNFFCPLNNVVVYDHLVEMKDLIGLKVIFLTGVEISKESLEAIKEFVSSGGLCISLTSLAPPEISKTNLSEVSYGKGKWILTEDFQSQEIRNIVMPYLGKSNEIKYRFGKSLLIIKKCGNNANKIQIFLQNEEGTPIKIW